MDTTDSLRKDPLSAGNKQRSKDFRKSTICKRKPPFGAKNKITNTARQQGEHYFKSEIRKEIFFSFFPLFFPLGFFSFFLIMGLVRWWRMLTPANPCHSWEVSTNTFGAFYISMYFNSFCNSCICKLDKFCKLLIVCVI